MIRKIDDGQTLTFVEVTLILNNWLVSVGMGTTSYSEQTLTPTAEEEQCSCAEGLEEMLFEVTETPEGECWPQETAKQIDGNKDFTYVPLANERVIGKDEFKQSIIDFSMLYVYLPSQMEPFKKVICSYFVYLSQMKKLSPRSISDLSEDLGTKLKFRASE